MQTTDKIYLNAKDISEMLGVSVGFGYKLIREMNAELRKKGYLVVAGKVPTAYFKEKWYGFSA